MKTRLIFINPNQFFEVYTGGNIMVLSTHHPNYTIKNNGPAKNRTQDFYKI